jgi:hypothetical protein
MVPLTECAAARSDGDTGEMGFNPNRKRVARRTDIAFVAAAVIAVIALVAWTAFG